MRRPFLFLFLLLLGSAPFAAHGEGETSGDDVSENLQVLRDEIQAREARMEQLSQQIDRYGRLIDQAQEDVVSLEGETRLLEHRIEKTRLDVESTQTQVERLELSLRLLDAEIVQVSQKLEQDRRALGVVLRQMEDLDALTDLEAILRYERFSDFFDQWSRWEQMRQNLRGSLYAVTLQHDTLSERAGEKEAERKEWFAVEKDLQIREKEYSEAQTFKQLLLQETQESEEQYQELKRELQAEEVFLQEQIKAIQRAIEEKIAQSDLLGDSSILTLPVFDFIMTTTFHDPTYPFRYLFEHSGWDLAVDQGTPVASAAPGYVAFARTGRLYGNYVMVIHGNGLSTLYAHLSHMNVSADQFVARGDVIGFSGGRPGTAGAGFSTGPHLHFEVRLDGIPVDPAGYLPL